MKIADHNQALDLHTALLSSLSPISYTDQMIRTSVLIGPMMNRLAGEPYQQMVKQAMRKNGAAGRLEASVKAIDIAMGEGYFAKELAGFIQQELMLLRNAQTIFCSSDIVEEILEAQETMLDSIILPQDVFTETGLIFLQKPYVYSNLIPPSDPSTEEVWQKEDFLVSAIMFTATADRVDNNGIGIYLYGHWNALHIYDETIRPQKDTQPMCSYIYNPETKEVACVLPNDTVVDEELERMRRYEDYFSKIFKDRATGVPLLLDGTFFQYGGTDTEYDADVLELKRFLLAFFRLTYEYLEIERTAPEKAFRKRAKRSGRTIPEDGYITVMTLRRKVYHGDTAGQDRNSPAYAFRVRGHWKKAYMRSRKLPVGDPAAYKHIYVKDYIKGRGVVVKSKRLIKVGD